MKWKHQISHPSEKNNETAFLSVIIKGDVSNSKYEKVNRNQVECIWDDLDKPRFSN